MTDDRSGPFYDDLSPGHVFEVPPAVTVTSGLAAAYVAVTGDAPALSTDGVLCHAVTGAATPLVSPGLVLNLANGASTVATKRVLANLFYRNVVLRRPVFEGETLRTETRVLAMADSSPKPGARPRGKVLLGITASVGDEIVADYERCPLIPCRADTLPGYGDDIGRAGGVSDLDLIGPAVPADWDLGPLGPSDDWPVGSTRDDQLSDVVDQAPALVRLTRNHAAVHRDHRRSPHGQRLVYGGHSVSLASASLDRVLGGLATVLGWDSCDHTAPVFEGDLLTCRHTLLRTEAVAAGHVRWLHTEVVADRGGEPTTVLDWRPVVYTT